MSSKSPAIICSSSKSSYLQCRNRRRLEDRTTASSICLHRLLQSPRTPSHRPPSALELPLLPDWVVSFASSSILVGCLPVARAVYNHPLNRFVSSIALKNSRRYLRLMDGQSSDLPHRILIPTFLNKSL